MERVTTDERTTVEVTFTSNDDDEDDGRGVALSVDGETYDLTPSEARTVGQELRDAGTVARVKDMYALQS